MILLNKIVLQSGCLLLYYLSALAQESNLKVFIYQNDKVVEHFGIANISRSLEGQFIDGTHLIMANGGDELFIASKEFKNFYKIVSKVDISLGYIEVYMDHGVIALDEVVLHQRKLSYGTFTDYKTNTYTPAAARLKTATKLYYKDKPRFIGSFPYDNNGIRIALDPLFNMINGRTKRLKEELIAEQSDRIVTFLNSNYRKFILEELDLPKYQYYLFCYYVSDHNTEIHQISDHKRVEFLLRGLYFDFLQQLH